MARRNGASLEEAEGGRPGGGRGGDKGVAGSLKAAQRRLRACGRKRLRLVFPPARTQGGAFQRIPPRATQLLRQYQEVFQLNKHSARSVLWGISARWPLPSPALCSYAQTEQRQRARTCTMLDGMEHTTDNTKTAKRSVGVCSGQGTEEGRCV